MRKSILSAAVAMLMAGAAVGAQAQSLVSNGDFELSNVATGAAETFANISATQGWGNLQWGSYANSSAIVDTAGNQAARVSLGDVIWTAFQAPTAGAYTLSFDTVGDGFYAVYDASTRSMVSGSFLQNSSLASVSTSVSLNSTDIYRIYFGAMVLPPSFNSTLTIDNVAVTAAVPEPETYAMMLAGLGAIGLMSRRRLNGNGKRAA